MLHKLIRYYLNRYKHLNVLQAMIHKMIYIVFVPKKNNVFQHTMEHRLWTIVYGIIPLV